MRRAVEGFSATRDGLLAVIDENLASAEPHAAGTADRLLAPDRQRRC